MTLSVCTIKSSQKIGKKKSTSLPTDTIMRLIANQGLHANDGKHVMDGFTAHNYNQEGLIEIF